MLSRAKRALSDPARAAVNFANRVFYVAADGDRRPAFHDIDDIRPELRILDRNFAVIRNELDAVLAEKASIPLVRSTQTKIGACLCCEPHMALRERISCNARERPNSPVGYPG